MRIGAHESVAGGLFHAFARAEEHGGGCLQLFTKSARGWTAPPLTDADRRAFRKEAARSGLPAMAHGSYLVNLASEEPAIRGKSIACVIDELTRCERLGVRHLILHPGSHRDERTGLRLVAEALDEVHAATPRFNSRIALEVTAGQGSCLGWRFEHLAELLHQVRRADCLEVCLDTCHLFAAGHDISTRKGYEKTMSSFDHLVGLERVRCVHLNDCARPLGSRVDRHADIGKGHIGLTAFRCLVHDPRLADVLAVLETPTPQRYGASIRLLKSL